MGQPKSHSYSITSKPRSKVGSLSKASRQARRRTASLAYPAKRNQNPRALGRAECKPAFDGSKGALHRVFTLGKTVEHFQKK